MTEAKRVAPVETELKFDLVPDRVDRLWSHALFSNPSTTTQLTSTYFDTEDRKLQRNTIGLRVRRQGEGFVQTVKGGGGGMIRRDEWEAAIAGEALDPAQLRDTPVWKLVDGDTSALQPVFTTSVERISRLWTRGADTIEVSLDRGEITASGERVEIHELELELKAGAVEALFDLARELSADGAIRLAFESKAHRGYRLADGRGQEPMRAGRVAISPDLTAGHAFQRIGLDCLAQVAENARLLSIARNPEAVHQLRIGIRRFRAALSAFEPIVLGEGAARARIETKWLATEMDEARDLDVFVHDTFHALASVVDAPETAAGFERQLLEAQSRAYERAVAALNSDRYATLLLETVAWLEIGDWTRSQDQMAAALREGPASVFAPEALRHLRKAVRKKGRRLAHLDAHQRHKLRIKGKKLRYAAEFFSGLCDARPARRRKFLSRLRRLQDRLGELNDLAVAREKAAQLVQHGSPDIAFAAGQIVGARQAEEKALARKAADAYADFAAARRFWAG